ncbi:MAG TPA: hypothetical protein VHY19_08820 [Steroidobacteraceae bacterium]|jgi:hypothetical protein|nr:hypothetical protein [Steroidobacteraceae bacterium]
MRKKTPSRRPPLPFEIQNLDHRPPVTRREFLGRGMLTTSATLIGAGSFFSMFANPRKAYATLATDIQGLVNTPCNIRAGAGKIPFIAFDLAGGGNIAGSNALVGGSGGQLDFLTTAGYNKLGLPGSMIPNSSMGTGNFINNSLGLAMHSDSAYLRGIQSVAATATQGMVNGAVIPAISQTDTDLNPHNPMFGIHTVGAAGALLVLIGTQATTSGGNSEAPSYMIDQSVLPTVVRQPSDVTGLVSTGSLVGGSGGLSQPAAVDVLESAVRFSNMKLGVVSPATGNSATDTAISNVLECSYVDAAYLVDKYGNAQQQLDPMQDTNITGGSNSIFTAEQLQDSDFLATAAVMKMVVNGYAGAGTIEMGGFDYHTGDRMTGEGRDFKAGQCIGACLEYASRVGVPLMIYIFSDGSLASNGMIDNSVGGRGKGVWTADNTATAASLMLVFDPRGRPTAISNQIGSYNSDGTVNATGSVAANAVNLLAETVVLNYMALHGQESMFQDVVWANGVAQGLGSASTYQNLIAFQQAPSVSAGGIILPPV